jgi:outer membrane protein, heavy metal efflux system
MKLRNILLLIAGMSAAAAAAQHAPAHAPAEPMEISAALINELADEARINNPALRAASARIDAARANERAVRTWEDPMVEVGAMGARRAMRMDEGDVLYGIEQSLPLWGKPRAARTIAQAEARRELADEEYQFQLLRRDVAVSLFQLALTDHLVAIGRQDLDWLETLVDATEQRYAAGTARQVELLRLQTERARRADQLQTDLRRRANDELTLNRLLNRDLNAPWPRPDFPPVAQPIPFSPRLVRLATTYEPRLKVLDEEIKQAQATADLTRRQRRPDVRVGAEARHYSGDGSFRQGMLTLSFNVPWGNARKYRSDIEREEARTRAAQLNRADYELSVIDEIHHLTVRIDAARREALLYRDEILPRAEQTLELERAAFQANQGVFAELLEARRFLLEAQVLYVRALAEQYQAISELVLCCGIGDLDALQMFVEEDDQDETPNNSRYENR